LPAISTSATDTTEQVDQTATPAQRTGTRAKPRIRYGLAAIAAAAVFAALLAWVSAPTSPARATPSAPATPNIWVAKSTAEAAGGVVWIQDGNPTIPIVANGFIVGGTRQGQFLIATSRSAHLTQGVALNVLTEGPTHEVHATITDCPSSGPIEFLSVTLPVQMPILQLVSVVPPGGLKAGMLGYWDKPYIDGTFNPSNDPYEGRIVIQQASPQAVQFTQNAPTAGQQIPAGHWVPYGKPIIDGDNRVIGMETSGTTAVTGKQLSAALLAAAHSSTGNC
jgi:hypothetical protein